MIEFEHLAISGGGIKAISIIGSLEILFNNGHLNNLKNYIGSSAGGLICLFLIIGYKCEELVDLFLNLNFEEYRDISILNIENNWGLDNGDKLMKLIISIIKQKNISKDITFIELFNLTNKNLILTGSELLSKSITYFNKYTFPNMKVLDAIRITISYPIIFEPIKFNNGIYVDGGLYAPYPIDYYYMNNEGIDVEIKKDKILGITIHNKCKVNEIKDGEEYFFAILNSLQEKMEFNYLESLFKKNKYNVIINIDEINGMDFSLTYEKKIQLYELGKDSAKTFIL